MAATTPPGMILADELRRLAKAATMATAAANKPASAAAVDFSKPPGLKPTRCVSWLSPPPGLDDLGPQHPQQPQPLQQPQAQLSGRGGTGGETAQQAGSVGDKWATSVLEMAPFLDQRQSDFALGLLSRAMDNAQRLDAVQRVEKAAGLELAGPTQQLMKERVALLVHMQLLRQCVLPLLAPPQPAPTATAPRPKAVWVDGAADGAANSVAEAPACPTAQTLSKSLQAIANEDPACLFIVRRISKLHYKADRILKQHFSAYGTVVRVLVVHSSVKSGEGQGPQATRRRPSSLGFVQMQTAEAVQKVLASGAMHVVKGIVIRVQMFEHKEIGSFTKEFAHEDGPQAAKVDVEHVPHLQWKRSATEESNASVSTAATTSEEELV